MARFNSLSLVSLLALGMALPAFAQTPVQPAPQPAPPAEAEQEQGRNVIVVTANKREESVQDVAVAVTALTSQDRVEIGLTSVQDLTNMTPGLSYSSAVERVYLRGIGRNTNNFGSEPGVANYDNGVYTSFATIGARDQIFVERTEILRGPQGTLYGRNSIGGALNVVNKRPESDFGADFRATVGAFNSKRIALSLTGPITDWLNFKVAGSRREQRDGYLSNVSGLQDEFGPATEWYGEVQLEANLGENLDLWWRHENGQYKYQGPPGGRVSGGDRANFNTSTPFENPATFPTTPNFGYGFTRPGYTQVGSVTTNPTINDLRTFNTNITSETEVPAYDNDVFEAVYHAPGFDLKYLGGYIYYHYDLKQDLDNTPVSTYTLPNPVTGTLANVNGDVQGSYQEDRAFFSNEINFISTWDGPLQLIGGLYQYQENYYNIPLEIKHRSPSAQILNPVLFNGAAVVAAAPNPEGLLLRNENTGIAHSYGVFAQADYQMTDQLKFTGGIRYTYDLKKMREDVRLLCYLACTWSGQGPFAGLTGFNIQVLDVTSAYLTGVDGAGNYGNGLLGPPTVDAATGRRTRYMQNDWDAFTGTAGVEWTPDTDTLIYAKYSRGYKAGGFRPELMNPFPQTDEELVDAYEGGLKHEFTGLNLTTNLAAFYYNYQNAQTPLTIQPSSGPSFTGFVNIPEVQTTGFEVEANWQPIDDLNIMLSYAYLNAEIADGCCYVNSNDPAGELPGVVNVPSGGQNLEGKILPQSPKNKLGLNGRYTMNFDAGSLTTSLSYYWRDKFYSSIFNSDYNETPAYDQTDARLIWNGSEGHYTIIGFVRNLFDQDGYDSVNAGLRQACSVTQPTTLGQTAAVIRASSTCTGAADGVLLQRGLVTQSTVLTPPRTWGVEFQLHF